MAVTPFMVDRFSGLNLFADPEEVGPLGAVSMLNVDLDRLGRIRTRDGWSLFTSTAATLSPAAMSYYKNASGFEYIVAVTDAAVTTSYDLSTPATTTTVATVTDSNNGFARFGDTSNTRLYMADGTTSIRRFNGTVWATVAIGFTASYLTVTPTDNRLAVAAVDTVAFSGAGTPETFGVNDFVTLTPGDGETLAALVTWRDFVFAFKQSKFFVFTNTSVDTDGQPIFNYRPVVAGHGVYASGAAVAGEEGVYFADLTGIYVTTGDTPRYLSKSLEPWLRLDASLSTDLPTFNLKDATLVYYDRRLYVTDRVNQVTIVYDPALDAWLVWQITATGMCAVPRSSIPYHGVYFGVSASKKIALLGSSSDNGSAISWRYTSGAYDISQDNRVSVTLESAVWGTGTVTLTVANDHGSFDTGSALTLGTSPAVAQAWQQIDREGTFWQHKFTGSGVAVVNRLTHYVSFMKPAGIG